MRRMTNYDVTSEGCVRGRVSDVDKQIGERV